MSPRITLSTRISVIILVSLALVTAAVTLYVMMHVQPSTNRASAQPDVASISAPHPPR